MKFISYEELEECLSDYPPLMTVEEVSEVMRCSTQATRNLIREDRIKVVKAGRRYLFTKPSIIEYMTSDGE
jgi:excisionase family DNA binding protein